MTAKSREAIWFLLIGVVTAAVLAVLLIGNQLAVAAAFVGYFALLTALRRTGRIAPPFTRRHR